MSKNTVTTISENAQDEEWPIQDAVVTQRERALRSGTSPAYGNPTLQGA